MSKLTTVLADLKRGLAAGLSVGVLTLGSAGHADDFTAGSVIEVMEPGDRYPFVSGIVEGLAHARYQADGDTGGRSCIYKWFYEEEASFETVLAAFARFQDYLPGAVVGALIERKCG